MGKVIVTSGWGPSGYDLYGRNFAEGFAQFWPGTYDLAVYIEAICRMPRGECRQLAAIPGVMEFIARHRGNPEACGTKANKLWRPKHITRGYNFRFDAVKFCRQMFIPFDASMRATGRALLEGRNPDDDVIVWLDGDVLTHSLVSNGYIEDTLGDADLCYLGRTNMHSEIGFWACRNNMRGREFMAGLADTYATDRVFKLKEWHSAFVFDDCREQAARDGLRVRNLTPNGTGHVWFQSTLCAFSDHLKGDTRKRKGQSLERIGQAKRRVRG